MSDDLKELNNEDIAQGVRRRVEYSDEEHGSLVLTISKRNGGKLILPLLEHATTSIERDAHQDNTMMRIRPLAQLPRPLPSRSTPSLVNTGIATAMIRPGYLYVFFEGKLWRELEIDTHGRMSDTDLSHYRQRAEQGHIPNDRISEGEWLDDLLLPVLLKGRAVMHEVSIAYSEIAWSWPYIEWLERSPSRINERAMAVGFGYAAALHEDLTLAGGFLAERIQGISPLRQRDLGIELMLENPQDFTPDFSSPHADQLCVHLRERWKQIEAPAQDSAMLELGAEPGSDLLEPLRQHQGIVGVVIPDPLFALRHSLAQLHLTLHYLDALDKTLESAPLAHSAMLIRQAVFDATPESSAAPLAKFQQAIDRDKLDSLLEQGERDATVALIDRYIERIGALVNGDQLKSVLRDFTSHDGLGVVEAYALGSDLIGLLQQIPGVIQAQGSHNDAGALALLERLLTDESLLALWAPSDTNDEDAMAGTSVNDESANDGSGTARPDFLRALVEDTTELSEPHLEDLGLQGLGLAAKQLNEQQEQGSDPVTIGTARSVLYLVKEALGGWSGSVLRAVTKLHAVTGQNTGKFDGALFATASITRLTDAQLKELRLMRRSEVDLTRYSIIGVYGEGLSFGLTPEDHRSEALKRRENYLYADSSTGSHRMHDEADVAIRQTAGHSLVYVLPLGHPEAHKFSTLKLRVANGTRSIIDGPGMSKVLVGLAIYNLINESVNLVIARQERRMVGLSWVKVLGAGADLTAATMKLYRILMKNETSNINSFILRPLFDLKPVPLVGSRLTTLGAETIVNTFRLASFIAGVITVGISIWELRNSLSQGDSDAAFGHGVAIAGGLLFLGGPLMAGLLLVPGWGWMVLGLGVMLGGSTFAALVTDGPFERLLKQGPFGTAPDTELVFEDDALYFSQLLTLLSPLQVNAQRYGDLPHDPVLASLATEPPSPNDYLVTIATPLISRFQTGDKLGIVIQELEYTHSTYSGNAIPGAIDSIHLTRKTDLRHITARQSLPQQSAVRFIVKRDITDRTTQDFFHTEQRFGMLRVAIQAELNTELGAMVYPTPALEAYQDYRPGEHSQPPDKQRTPLNPFANDIVPYWSIKEVEV